MPRHVTRMLKPALLAAAIALSVAPLAHAETAKQKSAKCHQKSAAPESSVVSTFHALSDAQLEIAKRVFTGRGRPPPVVSSAELGQTLMQDQHALIYVDGSERPRNTRVVLTLD